MSALGRTHTDQRYEEKQAKGPAMQCNRSSNLIELELKEKTQIYTQYHTFWPYFLMYGLFA